MRKIIYNFAEKDNGQRIAVNSPLVYYYMDKVCCP